MVRQAQTYLVGAMSGVTLIAIAIAAFVMLVSTQVFTDWPIAGLGSSDEAAVSDAQPAGSGADGGAAAAAAGAKAGGANAGGSGAGGAQLDGSGDVQPGSSSGGEPAAGGGGGQGGSGNAPAAQGSPNGSGANPSSPASGGSAGGSGAASSPSQTATTTVNETVKKVDEAVLGGALGNTGVTDTSEDVLNGVAGPESTVGKVVDGVTGAVGGLLNPKP